ncbi:lipopolysaccharide core heptose(I) kinase RfaP [Malonomonas rubra]|uniref:lipopolysaccharide core heptose(I) kinase RfaP n=1 Tax=Malonomonas rubra TaxID=57040 RepID=UPI0026F0D7CC|nr:lipopolysaccharide core heptose(I) kinase RfaP [Malonomonas rubra]
MIELRADLAKKFSGKAAFDRILALQGEVYRELAGRRTLRWEHDGHGYFAKLHFGVGWREILKNLLTFRLPVLGAENEYRAIRRCEELGIATMTIAGYGRRGWNPARQQSFLITDELVDVVSLEDVCRDWPASPLQPGIKWSLIREVAAVARKLHENGVNHRDFYLCHFLAKRSSLHAATPELHLIDLHRVQLRRQVPRRWLVKDLGGLLFSTFDIGLSRRDWLRFLRAYRGQPLRTILTDDRDLLYDVLGRAIQTYRSDFGKDPFLPRGIHV